MHVVDVLFTIKFQYALKVLVCNLVLSVHSLCIPSVKSNYCIKETSPAVKVQ